MYIALIKTPWETIQMLQYSVLVIALQARFSGAFASKLIDFMLYER